MALTPTAGTRPEYGFMNWYLESVVPGRSGPFTHQGAGPNIIYVDPANELVIVTRWTFAIYRIVEEMIRAMGKDPYSVE